MTNLNSNISWCNATWNWAVGCNKVSAGCDNCYASALVGRGFFGHAFEDVQVHLNRLDHVRKFKPIVAPDGSVLPPLVFTNSMSDAWHERIPDAVIHKVLDVQEAHPDVIFQVLTKRPIRARQILVGRYGNSGMPANFWIGVSVEDNQVAKRLDLLRSIKERAGGQATFFASVEPIVGPTDDLDFTGVDWAIFGGESGPKARVMQADWLLTGIERAQASGSAIWLKQHGQVRSNPLLHHAPSGLGIKAQFQWIVDAGLEVLPAEKGGATLEGRVTHRAFPPGYHALAARMNAARTLI